MRTLALLAALAALAVAILATTERAIAEDLRAPAPGVAAALDLLAEAPATADLRPVLDEHDVTIRFVAMAPGIYARYSVAQRTIEIDQRWESADAATLAAVVAHEAVHARDAVSGYLATGGATACLGSEIRAFRTTAHFWTETYGPAGKPNPSDELEQQLNLVAQRQLRDPAGLERLVRQAYADQCAR